MKIELTNYEIKILDNVINSTEKIINRIELLIIYIKNSNNEELNNFNYSKFSNYVESIIEKSKKQFDKLIKIANKIKNQNWIDKKLHSLITNEYNSLSKIIENFDKSFFYSYPKEYLFISEFINFLLVYDFHHNYFIITFILEDELDINNKEV